MNITTEILEAFRAKISEIPIHQRGQSIAIYNILKTYYKGQDKCEAECKANSQVFIDAQFKITTKSDEIIEGTRKVNDDELEQAKEFLQNGESIKEEDNDSKRMEKYWATCIKNCGIFVSDEDEKVLSHCTGVDMESTDDETDKSIKRLSMKMKFSKNEWFSDADLTTVVELNNDEPVSVKGTKPNWEAGKNYTCKTTSKTQKNKKSGKTREITKTEEIKSFFNMFADIAEVDEGDVQDFEKTNVYSVGEDLESMMECCSYSLEYYLNCQPDMDEFEDEGNSDIEEDDEEDDEEPSPTKGKKGGARRKDSGKSKGSKGKGSHKGSGDVDPKQQECKQN